MNELVSMDGRSVKEAVEFESFITGLASKNAELECTADHEWYFVQYQNAIHDVTQLVH